MYVSFNDKLTLWQSFRSLLIVVLIQRSCVVSADAEKARAHAAPTGFNAIDIGGGEMKDFLKIPGGYRDGFQKVIFEEVGPTNVAAAPDFPLNDRFGAYDDNSVVSDNAEAPLFIPLPYRNETGEEKAERERKEETEKQARRGKLRPTVPPTAPRLPPITRTIISNAFNGQKVTIRPTVSPASFRPRQPASFSNKQPAPLGKNQQQRFNRPFNVPQQPLASRPASSQSLASHRPSQQRPTKPFGQFQRPVGFTLAPPKQPQFGNISDLQQQSIQIQQTLPPSTFESVRTNLSPGNRLIQPSSSQSFVPRLPAPSTTSPPLQQQLQNQFRQLRPFRPSNSNPVPESSSIPVSTTRSQNNLRTGVCSRTIYYKPQEASAVEIQQTYSHFAVVVSDQCARTCHEFNCAQAIFDPNNRHCQFNPTTAFSSQQTCEQWPNPIYRNNLPITQRAISIKCVTCQVRRSTPLRPFQRQNKALGISQVQFGPIGRSTLAHRIQGVIISNNFNQTSAALAEDHMLNRSLEAELVVNAKPGAIKTTNLDHLGPLKSSLSSASDEQRKADEVMMTRLQESNGGEINDVVDDKDNEAEPQSLSRQIATIVVHKLNPSRM